MRIILVVELAWLICPYVDFGSSGFLFFYASISTGYEFLTTA